MISLILRTTTRILLPLLLLYSIFLLLRGHNFSGGGFAGGLVAGAAFALYAIAYDTRSLHQLLRVDTRSILPLGLGMILLAGIIPLFYGLPFLTGVWSHWDLPKFLPVDPGTPLLFDVGVYFVVIGVVLTILTHLMEE